MEKLEKQKIQKDTKVQINMEKLPQFGTHCSEINKTKYFVPFIPNDFQKLNLSSSYISIDKNYYSKETFYIYLVSKEQNGKGSIKIEIKLKNIEFVENITRDGETTFYFYLLNAPKVYIKVDKDNKIKPEINYVSNFCLTMDDFSFINHYHLSYERTNKRGIKTNIHEKILVEHFKKKKNDENKLNKLINNSDEISFDIDDNLEFSNYVRMDSYLSLVLEYTNFYLLNLVMRLRVRFNSSEEKEDFITELKLNNLLKNFELNSLSESEDANRLADAFIRKKTKLFYKIFYNLHFNLQYSILCLITQKRLNIFSFDTRLLEKLEKMNCEEQNKASIIIELMIKNQVKLYSQRDLLEVFNSYFNQDFYTELLSVNDKDKQNIDIMKTRTIEVTPSIIYYKQPVFEKMNHILRKYSEYKDNFIKVNFVDEESNKIFLSSQSMRILVNFQRNVMLGGIAVGSLLFEFLSASNSQMKNSSYWFFCLEGTRFLENEQIIKELGDFTKETNIHKNAARRGQCLSTTSFIKNLNSSNIKLIPDIKRNNYIFTDGIGMISPDLAEECARAFKQEYASAFQIRIGGIKGIVAVNPELNEKEMICVRPSMVKFESNDTELGVIRCSSFSQGYLNRQIITLLSTLGVSDDIFLNMLQMDLSKYDNFIESPDSFLYKNYNISELMKKCYFFMPCLKFYSYNNLEINNEPFLSSIVLNLAISKIYDLKNKGKILDKYSAVLFGTIDETNSLEEGEVYIQIKRESIFGKVGETESFVLDTNVVVTKNPCLHPGDIKLLKANNKCTALKHMINTIVFSAKGKRPIQNEISGGDLDGDSYFISWNSNIINNIKLKNIKSLEETKLSTESQKNKEIKMIDIVNSYIDYMKNDTIALISNMHAAYADNDYKGAFSDKCLKLAELFSIAIDAPKNGNFVNHDEFKKYSLQIKQYPDFLENASFPSYESPGILGQLYRLIDINRYLCKFEYNEYKFNYMEDYLIELKFVSEHCDNYIKEAYKISQKYQNEIRSYMKSMRVLHESEFFLCENLHDKKRNKQNKHSDIFTELNTIKEKYRTLIINTFSHSKSCKNYYSEISYDVASAFYVVTYLNNKSISKYHNIFIPKFEELISLMINDRQLNNFSTKYQDSMNDDYLRKSSNEFKLSFDKYQEFKGRNDIISQKRIFSLPWLIKEIREKLFKNKNNYQY